MGNLNSITTVEPVEEIIEKISDIPMLPQLVTRLLGVIGERIHSTKDMVKIIETDSALTSRILKVANSAAFFRGQNIHSVSQAVIHLGERTVVGIAIGSCTSNIFHKPLEGYAGEEGELWDHSLRTAIASREVSVMASKKTSADLVYTAGLLHDIGKVIISEFLVKHTEELTRQCHEGLYVDFTTAEKHRTGTDHSQVGFSLAKHWKLPEPICEVIRYHHSPAEAGEPDRELVYAVHIGDILAMLGGSGTGADALSYRIDPSYGQYFDINEDNIPNLLLQIQEDFSRAKSTVFSDGGI